MKKVLNIIRNIGMEEGDVNYLSQKVRLTNEITFYLVFGVCLPFSLISVVLFGVEYPLLYTIPLFGAFMGLVVFLFNYFHFYNASRILLTLVPVVLIQLHHSYLANLKSGPIPASFMLQMSVSLIPFIIFNVKERIYLILLGIANMIAFLSFGQTNALLEYPIDDSLFREGFFNYSLVFCSISISYFIVYYFLQLNRKLHKTNEGLIKAMDNNKAELEASEKKQQENLQKLEEAQREEKTRNWVNEGLALFGDLLRKTGSNLDEMAYQITAKLVDYLDFNQGGLFLLIEDDGEEFLEMKASYAYNREKFIDRKINVEHGLLGQCVQEKEMILLKDIPQDYIHISSGLGDANPSTLLMVPLKVGNEIFGAIELASFNDIKDHQVHFIKKLSEDIAVSISSAKINEKTKILLEDSQMMTEQMKAQEEEMRQNFEELQSIQEEMSRKNGELEKLLKEKTEREVILEAKVKELEKGLK